jgi:hypothetical protein
MRERGLEDTRTGLVNLDWPHPLVTTVGPTSRDLSCGSAECKTWSLTYDLFIRRVRDDAGIVSEPIDRHGWLNLAITTPALMLKQRPVESADDDVDYPAFTLLGQFDRPTLFWRDGAVIVRSADDGYVTDLRAIADRLGASLLDGDGRDVS